MLGRNPVKKIVPEGRQELSVLKPPTLQYICARDHVIHRNNHRHTASHGFEHRHGKILCVGWQYEEVRQGEGCLFLVSFDRPKNRDTRFNSQITYRTPERRTSCHILWSSHQ